MNELRQCEEAFLDPDGPREYRVPEISEEVYEDLRLTREMEMAENDDIKPELELSGQDGNIFMIVGRATRAAKKAGWSAAKVEEYQNAVEAAQSYDEALRVTMRYFDVC